MIEVFTLLYQIAMLKQNFHFLYLGAENYDNCSCGQLKSRSALKQLDAIEQVSYWPYYLKVF